MIYLYECCEYGYACSTPHIAYLYLDALDFYTMEQIEKCGCKVISVQSLQRWKRPDNNGKYLVEVGVVPR